MVKASEGDRAARLLEELRNVDMLRRSLVVAPPGDVHMGPSYHHGHSLKVDGVEVRAVPGAWDRVKEIVTESVAYEYKELCTLLKELGIAVEETDGLVAVNCKAKGCKDGTPPAAPLTARALAWMFLELPWIRQAQIAKDLALLEDGDSALPQAKMWHVVFARARDRGQVTEMADAVQAVHDSISIEERKRKRNG